MQYRFTTSNNPRKNQPEGATKMITKNDLINLDNESKALIRQQADDINTKFIKLLNAYNGIIDSKTLSTIYKYETMLNINRSSIIIMVDREGDDIYYKLHLKFLGDNFSTIPTIVTTELNVIIQHLSITLRKFGEECKCVMPGVYYYDPGYKSYIPAVDII